MLVIYKLVPVIFYCQQINKTPNPCLPKSYIKLKCYKLSVSNLFHILLFYLRSIHPSIRLSYLSNESITAVTGQETGYTLHRSHSITVLTQRDRPFTVPFTPIANFESLINLIAVLQEEAGSPFFLLPLQLICCCYKYYFMLMC